MTRLSNRQYPMLKAFTECIYMSVEQAKLYDQRPFRSMLIRQWIKFHPKHGFQITQDGQKAWNEFRSTEIWRLHPERPLTAYFDAKVYGLTAARRPVHMMRRGAA